MARRGVPEQPVKRAPMPRGDRVELWMWDHIVLDLNDRGGPDRRGSFTNRRLQETWAVEFGGDDITGAFGPLDAWHRESVGDLIIRNAAVIGVMERRRDEFKRLPA